MSEKRVLGFKHSNQKFTSQQELKKKKKILSTKSKITKTSKIVQFYNFSKKKSPLGQNNYEKPGKKKFIHLFKYFSGCSSKINRSHKKHHRLLKNRKTNNTL